MFAIIAAIISAILGFGTGLVGINPSQPQNLSIPNSPTPYFRACYLPNPNVRLTLRWPNNFVNVPDLRPQLNPKYSNLPPTFNSTSDLNNNGVPDCKAKVLNSNTNDIQQPVLERSYIQVRTDVRIASCKTDELAGPYGLGFCPETENAQINVIRHRGSCYSGGYTELRKIAQVIQDGESKEIFWNPFSYNVGCNYEPDKNCGPGDPRTNLNLKDFIYVLKKRDAFDPASRPGCPVLWDAGSTNADACSHYFDVYLAEDVYLAAKDAPPTADPNNPFYFIKNIVERCTEQSHFTPVPDSILWIPPSFIRHPFLSIADSLFAQPDKINPTNQTEGNNYQFYVWSKPIIFIADVTNLVKIRENQSPINICRQNVPKNNCYDPIGTISFRSEQGAAEKFKVYSQVSAPQTFILISTTDTSKSHVYMITDKDFPTNNRRDPTLQLRSMEFIAQNQWTWATPWCKPAIYLYPEKETELNVKLNLSGQLTHSNPPYDAETGWQIKAFPNGNIQTTNDELSTNNYPYLFYEAEIKGVNIPNQGWVVERSNLKDQISKIMTDIGFNNKEIEDFLSYWLPKLLDNPYYFITLLPIDEINRSEKLEFSQTPDSLIRVRFVFEGLDFPLSVSQLEKIDSFPRKGFTVTDWGGTIVGRSCEVSLVK